MVSGANSSRPTGSFRQRPKPSRTRKSGNLRSFKTKKTTKALTDADHYLTLKEPCVASLRSDRHEIGMTDRHRRNAHQVSPQDIRRELIRGFPVGARRFIRGAEQIVPDVQVVLGCYDALRFSVAQLRQAS